MNRLFASFSYQTTPHLFVSMLFLTLLLVYGVPVTGRVVHAAGGSANFSMQPAYIDPANTLTKSYFVLASKAGATLQNGVRITNTGSATGTVTLYPVDATTGQNSGLVYSPQNAPRTDVGAWLQLGQRQVTLNVGESAVVPFQLNIPQDSWSGQHIGGIVAESDTQANTQQQNTFHVNVKSLSIVAVQVTLDGPLTEQLDMMDVQAGGANGYQNFLVNLKNSGTTLLKPYGVIQVTNGQGTVLQHIAVKLDTFLPHTIINYPVYVQSKPLTEGIYTVDLQLTYGHQKTLHTKKTLTITRQQLAQIYKAQSPLRLVTLPSGWQGLLIGLLLVLVAGCILFASYTLCRKLLVLLSKKRVRTNVVRPR